MESKRRWKAVFYTTEAGRCPVLEAIRGLPETDRVEIGQTLRLVQQEGPAVGMPFTEQVTGEIGAVRVRVGRTRWRIFFTQAAAWPGTGDPAHVREEDPGNATT